MVVELELPFPVGDEAMGVGANGLDACPIGDGWMPLGLWVLQDGDKGLPLQKVGLLQSGQSQTVGKTSKVSTMERVASPGFGMPL